MAVAALEGWPARPRNGYVWGRLPVRPHPDRLLSSSVTSFAGTLPLPPRRTSTFRNAHGRARAQLRILVREVRRHRSRRPRRKRCPASRSASARPRPSLDWKRDGTKAVAAHPRRRPRGGAAGRRRPAERPRAHRRARRRRPPRRARRLEVLGLDGHHARGHRQGRGVHPARAAAQPAEPGRHPHRAGAVSRTCRRSASSTPRSTRRCRRSRTPTRCRTSGSTRTACGATGSTAPATGSSRGRRCSRPGCRRRTTGS